MPPVGRFRAVSNEGGSATMFRPSPPRRILATCLLAALVMLLGIPSAGRAQRPGAQVPPAPRQCTIDGEQRAEPLQVELRQPVQMTLWLSASCPVELPGKADILLALDHSGSMNQDGKAAAAREAVRQFVDRVDFERDRVGILAFNETAYIVQPLTTRRERVLSALDDMGSASGGTYIAQAIQLADAELGHSGRPDAAMVLVLLTDGLDDPGAMQAAAQQAHSHGIILLVVALGSDAAREALRTVASADRYLYVAPTGAQLAAIYHDIATIILTFAVADVQITDQLADDVTYVADSGLPDEPQGDRQLRWRRSTLGSTPTVIRYQLQIDRVGRLQPSQALRVSYLDGDGIRREVLIEPATVEVRAPAMHAILLPLTYRSHCWTQVRHADVVLVLDSSHSMKGQKLNQAIAAARIFLDLLNVPADRAALVTYDQTATLRQALTSDRQALVQALEGIASGSGTRIDRGLETALAVLRDPERSAANRPVIVLLSDGIQVEERPRAFQVGQQAREADIEVFTIGLGGDADGELLTAIASEPSHAYFAPQPSDLEAIYRRIAGQVICR